MIKKKERIYLMSNVLHICNLNNNKSNGISHIVPEHFLNQQRYANVGIINCNDMIIEKLIGKNNV
ncbi:hypothetical protein, partial [Pedobacter sp.]|uniref:hypothetical protein n=1 Tax=Pedobacter sp. TaxID=1411316 RepID=UPI003D7FBD90